MTFKLFLIVAILCAVQLSGSISKAAINSKYYDLFYQYYQQKDNFGETITLYGLYSKLLYYAEYSEIKTCYNIYLPSYDLYLISTFVSNLTKIADSFEKGETELPFRRFANILKTYPTNLKNFINKKQYDEAAKLMKETAAKAIFFDIRCQMVMEKHIKNNDEFFERAYSNYLNYRKEAKAYALLLKNWILECSDHVEVTDIISFYELMEFPEWAQEIL